MKIVSLIFLFQFYCFIAYNISLSYCCIIWFSDAKGCKSSIWLPGTRLLRIKCDVRKPWKGQFSSNQANGKSICLILQCYLVFGICEVDAFDFISIFISVDTTEESQTPQEKISGTKMNKTTHPATFQPLISLKKITPENKTVIEGTGTM